MTYGIKAVGFANGAPCPHTDQWVRAFDFDYADGIGFGVFTPKAERALKFAGAAEAFEFWRTQSKVRPFRDDGKPNRPLTSLTVVMEEIK